MAVAALLARDGHRVTVFDRFAASQPVGSGLMIQPTGQAVLADLDLLGPLVARSARVTRLFGQAGERVVLNVRYAALRSDHVGLGVHRPALFDILRTAVAGGGAAIRASGTVSGSRLQGSRRRLFVNDGETRPFDLVVDALGSRSSLSPSTGRLLPYGALWTTVDWPGAPFDRAALEQRYRRASHMIGLLPLGRPDGGTERGAFFWSLRADLYDDWRRAGLAAWREEVASLWPAARTIAAQIEDPAQLTFARYAHRTLRRPVAPALIHLGDAWHSASPQLGQGANMALLDAWALATALRTCPTIDAALVDIVRRRQRHVRLYQRLTALFTPVYQSDGRLIPTARDRLVAPLSRLRPIERLQAALVAGLVGNPLARLELPHRTSV